MIKISIKKLKSQRRLIGKWFLISLAALLYVILIMGISKPTLDITGIVCFTILTAIVIFGLLALIYINLKIRYHKHCVFKDVDR